MLCFSINSDISSRTNSIPKKYASCFVSSVFPTPVGPVKRKEQIGFSSFPMPAFEVLTAETTSFTAWSWPNITDFKLFSRLFKFSLFDAFNCIAGIFVIFEISVSISDFLIILPLALESFFCDPASSIRSIALSGSFESCKYLFESSTADLSASFE